MIGTVTLFVVIVWGGEFREYSIPNITGFCQVLGQTIERGTDTDYYCVCYEFPG
jgi:hypothetical protein